MPKKVTGCTSHAAAPWKSRALQRGSAGVLQMHKLALPQKTKLFYKRTDIFDYLWSLVKNDQTNIDNCLLKNSRDLRITNLLHSYLKYIPDYPEKLVTPNNSTLTDLINNIVVSGNADSDILGNTYAHIILNSMLVPTPEYSLSTTGFNLIEFEQKYMYKRGDEMNFKLNIV